MSGRKILHTTHFHGSHTEKQGKQWFWSTVVPNGNTVGDGGEGYNRLADAVNGFFAQQGVSSWASFASLGEKPVADFSKLEKIDANHYVIHRYEPKVVETSEKSEGKSNEKVQKGAKTNES